MNVKQKFVDLLPKKPWCTNVLTEGLRVLPRDAAAQRLYIQANGPTHLRWMIFDIDNSSADVPWLDADVSQPHITVARYDKPGSFHYFYLVDPSVRSSATARLHPQVYWSAVESALVERLEADPLYTALVCKNPLNSNWVVMWHDWNSNPYTLGELSRGLELNSWREVKSVGETSGRNCAVFNDARLWAYSAIRPYRHLHESLAAFSLWVEMVSSQVSVINSRLPLPLSRSEERGIARSISRWTWQRMTGPKYEAWRRQVACRGGKARAASEDMRALGRSGGLVTARRYDMRILAEKAAALRDMSALAAEAAAKRDMSALAATAAEQRDMSSLGQGRNQGSVIATSERQRRPWEAMGFGRTKYYELKKFGKLPKADY